MLNKFQGDVAASAANPILIQKTYVQPILTILGVFQ